MSGSQRRHGGGEEAQTCLAVGCPLERLVRPRRARGRGAAHWLTLEQTVAGQGLSTSSSATAARRPPTLSCARRRRVRAPSRQEDRDSQMPACTTECAVRHGPRSLNHCARGANDSGTRPTPARSASRPEQKRKVWRAADLEDDPLRGRSAGLCISGPNVRHERQTTAPLTMTKRAVAPRRCMSARWSG